MRTLCPNCATVFRITPDQLRARNGMVRCGQCQAVFNAFDSLVDEVVAVSGAQLIPNEAQPSPASAPAAVRDEIVELPIAVPDVPDEKQGLVVPTELPALTPAAKDGPISTDAPSVMPLDPIDAALAANETPEESTMAVREAGLSAVRELTEMPSYNRWAADTLGGDPSTQFHENTEKYLLWPFVVVALALTLTLLVQMAYYFRSELVQRLPDLRDAYAALDVAIPLPRSVDLVTIEASDLQSDNARGLLVLQATLKNRASFAQAWPVLELTLTDINDAVVLRKILNAADYLPPKSDSKAFAGNSEIGLKLWLESRQPAAGYRLYVFYP